MSDQSWKEKVFQMRDTSIKIEDAAKELSALFDRYEWFYDIVVEDPRVLTVYVDRMDKEISDLIPDRVYGYQVKLAFSSYLTCGDKYGAKPMALGIGDEDYE